MLEGENPANGIWTAGWRNGTRQHIVLTKDYQLADSEPAAVTVRPTHGGHVYDAREGRYFGLTDSIQTTLKPTIGTLLTVMPYRLTALELTSGPVVRGEDLVLQVRLVAEGEVGEDDLSVLRVRVSGPRGEVTALRRVVTFKGAGGEIRLPLSYDDPAGRWQVSVRDTATGLTAQAAYELP